MSLIRDRKGVDPDWERIRGEKRTVEAGKAHSILDWVSLLGPSPWGSGDSVKEDTENCETQWGWRILKKQCAPETKD